MEKNNFADGGNADHSGGDVVPSPGVNTGLPAGQGPQQGQRPARGSRRNKTVFKHVDLGALQQSDAEAHKARNITPAEYRSQTNGIPPMAIRNSEYAPVTGQGQNMNRTFGNVFQSMSQQRPKNYAKNEFAMKDDEFPSLK